MLLRILWWNSVNSCPPVNFNSQEVIDDKSSCNYLPSSASLDRDWSRIDVEAVRSQRSQSVYPVALPEFPASSVVPPTLLNDHDGEVVERVAHWIKVYCYRFIGELTIVVRPMTIHSEMQGVLSFVSNAFVLSTLVAQSICRWLSLSASICLCTSSLSYPLSTKCCFSSPVLVI